ncbi:MAG: glycosyltransferase family 4 protein [Flavobacteriales bacterium]|nr:glycosyltransferase family 4 protein [Flavobacteriales bacterium]
MKKKPQYKILFLAPYPMHCAPSQRLKYEQYYDHFEENGFRVTTSSFISLKFWKIIYKPGFLFQKFIYTLVGYLRRTIDILTIRRYDIVYVHLWVTPLGPPIFEWVVLLLAKRVIYDIDDMIFLGHISKANRMWFRLKGTKKVTNLMANADHVIVCSSQLYDYAKQLNHNVSDISSTINLDEFKVPPRKEDNSELVIGWTGSHSTGKYLHILDRVLEKLNKEYPFRLVVIGDDQYKHDNLKIDSLPWKRETEVKDLQQIDIGLYPLPFEDWVYGKSGLKAITFMSLGIPCVATAIGANNRIVEDGVNGYLVKTEMEWTDRLRVLCADKELRREMGIKGRKAVEEEYSTKANVDKYLQVLFQVLDEYSNYRFIKQN